ncbi:MAG: hypothetical protein ACRDSP_24805 [Pseudonocardiaceae bacterium]
MPAGVDPSISPSTLRPDATGRGRAVLSLFRAVLAGVDDVAGGVLSDGSAVAVLGGVLGGGDAMTTAVGWSEVMADQVRAQLAVLDLQAAGVMRRAVDVEGVRAQLRGLIGAWRRLLEIHHPADGESRCPRCRSWWGHRRRWPCGVWRLAHTSLVACQVGAAAPEPDAVAAAVGWMREPSPDRPPGARAVRAPRRSGAGESPGAATPDRPSPVGAAAPDTSRGPRHARPEPCAISVGAPPPRDEQGS